MLTKAFGAYAADKPVEPMDIERRAPALTMSLSPSPIAASAIPTCIRCAANGPERSIPVCRGMKSSAM